MIEQVLDLFNALVFHALLMAISLARGCLRLRPKMSLENSAQFFHSVIVTMFAQRTLLSGDGYLFSLFRMFQIVTHLLDRFIARAISDDFTSNFKYLIEVLLPISQQ